MTRTPARCRVLELYCGIGGCAAALPTGAEIVAAIDIDREALSVYRANWPHPTCAAEISSLSFDRWEADLWWLSPPCRPYSQRGQQRDHADSRSTSLMEAIAQACRLRPAAMVIENVPPFLGSVTWSRCWQRLQRAGFRLAWGCLCPEQIGWPMRRRRAYLAALRDRAPRPWVLSCDPSAPRLRDLLEPFDPNAPTGHEARLMAEAPSIQRVRHALHRVDPSSSDSVAACFASSYGRSILHAGSYLQTGGGLRRFSPREIARLMGFPESFDLSAAPTHRAAYRLLGNSLSVPVVRQLLAQLIEQLG